VVPLKLHSINGQESQKQTGSNRDADVDKNDKDKMDRQRKQ